jgi:hypothetical protein
MPGSAQIESQDDRAEPDEPVGSSFFRDFRERPTIAALGVSFSAVWVHKMPKTAAATLVICPDGTIDLQWIEGGCA